jgi:hypothetical protein
VNEHVDPCKSEKKLDKHVTPRKLIVRVTRIELIGATLALAGKGGEAPPYFDA